MRFEITYDSENDSYLYEGMSYPNFTDAMVIGMLGFCGCGMPWGSVRFVADLLSAARTRFDGEGEGLYEQFKEYRKSVFGENEGMEYLVWYILDHCELMEHGGSVPGWLTSKGEMFLKNYETFQSVFLEEEAD